MGPENSFSSRNISNCSPDLTPALTSDNALSEPFMGPLATLFSTMSLNSKDFDRVIMAPDTRLKVVFFWGNACPNCMSARTHLAAMSAELRAMPVEFHAVDAYASMDLVVRFGLYAIPEFLFFKHGRLIGRITSFPTRDEFLTALRRQL